MTLAVLDQSLWQDPPASCHRGHKQQGSEIVLDVAGEQRANMQVPDLLEMFSKVRGEELADDSLLLS